jgi:hypothetical protein
MDPAPLAAVVTASAALIASLIAGFISLKTQISQARSNQDVILLRDRLDSETRQRERTISARAELDELREPLLAAAKDLQQRIWNIRKNEFFSYLNSEDLHRREVALLGTLHRFARYWAMQELLNSRVNLLRFEADPDTQDVAELVRTIASTFASDSADGLNLIFWREEQRAVAELMVDFSADSPVPPVTGFATFRRRYKQDAQREDAEDLVLWFSDFARDLQSDTIVESNRLQLLDDRLKDLVKALEKGRSTTPGLDI